MFMQVSSLADYKYTESEIYYSECSASIIILYVKDTYLER